MKMTSDYHCCSKYIIGGESTRDVFFNLPGFEMSDDTGLRLMIGTLTIEGFGTFPVFIHPYVESNKVLVVSDGQIGAIILK